MAIRPTNQPAVITAGAHLRTDNASADRLVGYISTEDADGNTYTRDIDIVLRDGLGLDPVQTADLIRTGVVEMAEFVGYGGLHGWRMPFRSNDALLSVFEFDFDREPTDVLTERRAQQH